MSEILDTGFEAALAGEAYVHPEPEITVTVNPYPLTPHVCGSTIGSTRCDTCFGPVDQPTPTPSTPTSTAPASPSSSPISNATVTTSPPSSLTPSPILSPPPPGLTAAGVQAAKALVQLPATLDWPTMSRLAREIAMDIKERHTVLKDFGLTQVQYDFLEQNNEFYRSALAAACKDWHAPLSTAERIKVEAAAILEDSLLGLGARMQNKGEGLPGVIEAAKLFAKVAGVGEREGSALPAGERFVINIDLGSDQKISVGVEGAQAAPDLNLRASQVPQITKTP